MRRKDKPLAKSAKLPRASAGAPAAQAGAAAGDLRPMGKVSEVWLLGWISWVGEGFGFVLLRGGKVGKKEFKSKESTWKVQHGRTGRGCTWPRYRLDTPASNGIEGLQSDLGWDIPIMEYGVGLMCLLLGI